MKTDICTFMKISLWILRMGNFSGKSPRENQNTRITYLVLLGQTSYIRFFYIENRAVCETNIAERGRPQMTKWRMPFACCIPKAIYIHSEYVILLFRCNNGCTKALQRYTTYSTYIVLLVTMKVLPPHRALVKASVSITTSKLMKGVDSTPYNTVCMKCRSNLILLEWSDSRVTPVHHSFSSSLPKTCLIFVSLGEER
jgi:hypothetical protein